MTGPRVAVQVGTVEVLRLRLYPAPGGGDAIVEPGTYPLMSEPDGTVRWLMRGRRSTRHEPKFDDLGDGMFLVRPPGDEPGGEEIDVPSPSFTREQLRALLTEVGFVEGPEQRVRVRVEVEL